jgi:mannitol/fructose-specific phosphotransferase system IIA component (Ntr-type)
VRLLDYIDPACVGVGLPSEDKDGALRTLVGLVVGHGLAQDSERLLVALKQREEVVSTGIGNNVAIPHADLPEIEIPRLALGIFPDGVDFDAVDAEPVHIVFLLLGTPRTPGLHMRILARIARLSKDAEFSRLRHAERPEDALSTLARIEARR